jgi:hypothetical protein
MASELIRIRADDFASLTLAASSFVLANIDVNATTVKSGGVLSAANAMLIGTIEHISLYSNKTFDLGLVFMSGTVAGTNAATCEYIDHEMITAKDWYRFQGTGPFVYALQGLSIPYRDDLGGKQFHIGIYPGAVTSTNTGLEIEIGFRPNLGGG